jgi:hypothetical protein
MQAKQKIFDSFLAYGHKNVLGDHPTTLEFTKENFLTPTGNCIIGVMATKSVVDLTPKLKERILAGEKIMVKIEAGSFQEEFIGYGHPDLPLSNPVSMVFRKSDFISDRTVLIRCSKTARNINRKLITYLKEPTHTIKITLYSQEEQN